MPLQLFLFREHLSIKSWLNFPLVVWFNIGWLLSCIKQFFIRVVLFSYIYIHDVKPEYLYVSEFLAIKNGIVF